jgi:hypothetical protein
LIACSAAPDEGIGTSEAHDTNGARSLGVVKGRELARCWFDRVGDDEQLSCTSTAKGNDPLSLDVRVSVAGSNGFMKQLDVVAGGTVVVGKVAANSVPRDVSLQVYLGWDDRSMIGADDGDWSARSLQADASTITQAQPLIVSEPFDFWELGTIFAVTQGGGYSFTAHEYERAMTPYSVGLAGKAALAFTPEISGLPGKTKFIVAPKDAGPLAVTWSHDGKKIETSIPGPGYYAFTDDGIRAATPEEIASKFGAAPAPEPAPQPAPQPAPEPSWTDPDPSCGGASQRRCADRTCDPGTRWDYNQSCIACGTAGATFCFVDPKGSDPSTGKKCDAGTRWDYNQSCIACGDAGQTFCFADANGGDPSSGKKCNAGTRWDYNQSCIACGGEGQTFCFGDANHADPGAEKTCNEGLHLVGGSTCVK